MASRLSIANSIKFSLMLLVLALVGTAPGCARFTDSTHLGAERNEHRVYGPHTVGMAFVCHHAGLDGISVLLRSQAGTGDIVLHLRESPESLVDIATAVVAPLPSQEPTYHHFDFPLQDDVNGRSLFLLIESPDTDAQNGVVVPYSMEESSLHTLYLDGDPTPGQLSAELHYSIVYIVKDVGRQVISSGMRWVGLLFFSALLYLLPGGAAVMWLLQDGDWIERSIVAMGSSVAINALLLYGTMTGLRLSPALVIGFLVLCACIILAKGVLLWRSRRLRLVSLAGLWDRCRQDPSRLALLLVSALILGVRIFTVRDLAVPMWGDSHQHTMIAQLMVDNGGLFDSWEPYAPLKTFTYHFGFHANVALFHWLSRDSVIHSVIWIGQILNALAALVLYPLAVQVSGGRRWAGVGAVLVAGWLSPMPMNYVNWGRYTQLAAQVILPVAAWLIWQVLTSERHYLGRWVLVWLTVAGLLLTHYRVAIIAVLLLAVGWAASTLNAWKQKASLCRPLLHVLLGFLVPLALVAPWFWHVQSGLLTKIVGEFTRSQADAAVVFNYRVFTSIPSYVPVPLLVMSLMGLVVGLVERRGQVLLVIVWTCLQFLAAYSDWFYVPGAITVSILEGVLDSFTVLIGLYMPASILCGYLGGALLEVLSSRFFRLWKVMAAGLVLVLIGVGSKDALTVLEPAYVLVTDADLEAMQWIREHTPQTAKFLVNSFSAYGGNATVGSDAGWWIPILAGRENTVPPITYAHEAAHEPGYAARINGFARRVETISLASREALALLRDNGITHVYVGYKGGNICVDELQHSDYYQLAYHRDRVWVFEVVDQPGN
jgi:hypothetical protein